MASTLHEEAHRLSAHEVVERLATSSNSGLDPDDVERRRVEHGPNELESAPPVPAWRRFLAQFQDVLVVLLLAATVISTILWALEGTTGLPYEALAILCVVLGLYPKIATSAMEKSIELTLAGYPQRVRMFVGDVQSPEQLQTAKTTSDSSKKASDRSDDFALGMTNESLAQLHLPEMNVPDRSTDVSRNDLPEVLP